MSAPLRIRRENFEGIGAPPAGDRLKPYLDRLLKLIPAEVLSLFLVGNGVIDAGARTLLIGWTVFCTVATAIVKAYGTGDEKRNEPPDWTHVAISTFAFVLWVYSIGGPFAAYSWYDKPLGSLMIVAFTFIVPYVYRGKMDPV